MARSKLTERQQNILRLIIQEYIRTANPVGSKLIATNYTLGVSSATIRNEMAMLEEAGYLMQPHTSAGRVPTEAGYRYFVEKLMEQVELPNEEQRMISHQFQHPQAFVHATHEGNHHIHIIQAHVLSHPQQCLALH